MQLRRYLWLNIISTSYIHVISDGMLCFIFLGIWWGDTMKAINVIICKITSKTEITHSLEFHIALAPDYQKKHTCTELKQTTTPLNQNPELYISWVCVCYASTCFKTSLLFITIKDMCRYLYCWLCSVFWVYGPSGMVAI